MGVALRWNGNSILFLNSKALNHIMVHYSSLYGPAIGCGSIHWSLVSGVMPAQSSLLNSDRNKNRRLPQGKSVLPRLKLLTKKKKWLAVEPLQMPWPARCVGHFWFHCISYSLIGTTRHSLSALVARRRTTHTRNCVPSRPVCGSGVYTWAWLVSYVVRAVGQASQARHIEVTCGYAGRSSCIHNNNMLLCILMQACLRKMKSRFIIEFDSSLVAVLACS